MFECIIYEIDIFDLVVKPIRKFVAYFVERVVLWLISWTVAWFVVGLIAELASILTVMFCVLELLGMYSFGLVVFSIGGFFGLASSL